MFRVDSRFEIHIPPFLYDEEPPLRQFQVVEHCFNVPLWYVRVLPRITAEDDFQQWHCFLVVRAKDAIDILASQLWEGVKVHVLLPEYMTASGSMALTRCTSLWECETLQKSGRLVWLFETDLGSFVDPEFDELEPSQFKKRAMRWQMTSE